MAIQYQKSAKSCVEQFAPSGPSTVFQVYKSASVTCHKDDSEKHPSPAWASAYSVHSGVIPDCVGLGAAPPQ